MRFLILLLACGIVNAQSIDQDQANKSSGGNSYNAGTGNVKANAKQQQQQAMQQGQSQNIIVNVPDSLGSFSASGTPLATSTTDINFEAAVIPDNTPNIGGSSIYPSNPCHMVFNAGVSVPGFGASGGKTYIDSGCSARELARIFYGFGLRSAAIHILCIQPEAATVPDCNGVQDYNKEMALLKTDNKEFLRDYEDMSGEIAKLYDQNENLKESLREERMKKALAK